MKCDACQDTGWLGANEALGRCICAPTPPAEDWETLAWSRLHLMNGAADCLRAYFVRIGLGNDPLIIDDPDLREAWRLLTDG